MERDLKGVRMHFYAIEIARYVLCFQCNTQKGKRHSDLTRNRAGLNDWIYEKAQKASS